MIPVVLYLFLFLLVIITLVAIVYRAKWLRIVFSKSGFSQNETDLNQLLCKLPKISDSNGNSKLELKENKINPSIHSEDVAKTESKTLVTEEPYAAVVSNEFIRFTCSRCFHYNIKGQEKRISLRRCRGCKVLYYCSKECQKADWKDHKAECRFLRPLRGQYVPSKTVRLACRLLVKSKTYPEIKAFNGRSYNDLMDHCDSKRKHEQYMTLIKEDFDEILKLMGAERL